MSQGELDTRRLERFLDRPRRAVWVVSLPMMAGMLLHVGYNVVDTAFIGRLGPQALAGMTIVFPLFFVLIAAANGLGSGISVLIGQAIGRRDGETAERVAGTAVGLGLAAGLPFTAAGLLGGRWLLHHLGATDAVADAAWAYFSVIACMAPVTLVSAFLRYVLNGEGDARTPMFVMAAATLTNVALDPLFIFVLDLGIRGAALATLVTQLLAGAIFIYLLLFRRRNVVKLRLRNLWPRLDTVRQVLVLGVPASFSQLAMALGGLLMNRVVASFGDAGLAGYGAAARVDSIVAMPIMGLASGAVAVIAMFAGAGRADLVRSTAAYVFRWAVGIALVLGVGAFSASALVMRVFTPDPATIAVGRHYLSYMVFVYPLMGIGMVSGRLLLGLGFPLLSLLLTAVRVLAVAVPVAYISVYLFDAPIDGVWSGVLAGACVASVLALLLVRVYVWQRDPTRRARAGAAAPA